MGKILLCQDCKLLASRNEKRQQALKKINSLYNLAAISHFGVKYKKELMVRMEELRLLLA